MAMETTIKYMCPRIESPCRDCVNRVSGCHAACEAYARYRAEIDARNTIRAQRKTREYNLTCVEVTRYDRERNYHRR